MNIDDIIENAQLKGRIIALDAQVETLTAEVRCLEAVIRSHERVDCLTVANLKDEVARLHSQFANSEQENARLKAEVERLKAMDSLKTVSLTESTNWQAIGDYAETKEENARLKAEVERLTIARDYYIHKIMLKIEQIDALTSVGDRQQNALLKLTSGTLNWDGKLHWNWNAAKEGKPSV